MKSRLWLLNQNFWSLGKLHCKLLVALATISVAILSLGMAIKILRLGYACMQPCQSKWLNWPFFCFNRGLLWLQSRIPAIAQFGENTDRRGIFRAMLDIDCLSGSCLLGWLSAKQKEPVSRYFAQRKRCFGSLHPPPPHPPMEPMGGGERILKMNAAKLRTCNDLIQS